VGAHEERKELLDALEDIAERVVVPSLDRLLQHEPVEGRRDGLVVKGVAALGGVVRPLVDRPHRLPEQLVQRPFVLDRHAPRAGGDGFHQRAEVMAVDVGGPRHGGRRLRIDDGGGQARLLVLEVHVDGLGVVLPAHRTLFFCDGIHAARYSPCR